MDSEVRLPRDLKIVAWLFIVFGLLAATDAVASLLTGHVENMNPGWLGIFIGRGILKRSWGWLSFGVVCLLIVMLLSLLSVIFVIREEGYIFSISMYEIDSIYAKIVYIAGAVMLFLFALWQYLVLVRKDTKLLFGFIESETPGNLNTEEINELEQTKNALKMTKSISLLLAGIIFIGLILIGYEKKKQDYTSSIADITIHKGDQSHLMFGFLTDELIGIEYNGSSGIENGFKQLYKAGGKELRLSAVAEGKYVLVSSDISFTIHWEDKCRGNLYGPGNYIVDSSKDPMEVWGGGSTNTEGLSWDIISKPSESEQEEKLQEAGTE